MQNRTRELFNAFIGQVATLNGVPKATDKFSVAPSVQQKLETKIQESSEFLKRINIYGVTEQEGEKIGLSIAGPVASTTDTTQQDRQTRDLSKLDDTRYRCEQTNFDTHIAYRQLDAWAKFADFQTRLRDVILKRCALDRMMIGFNGVKRVATSDPLQNPLLQDVNIGWLQKYREQASERVMSAGGGDTIAVGKGGDYANLDALVMDATASLLDPWFQEDPALVVICGRQLLHDKYFPLVNQDQKPVDQLAVDVISSQKRIGNLPAVRVPYFPANAMMVTRFDNLSIYWQEGGRRRTIVDNAKRDRIENFESSNDAYVIENYGAGCVVENIELVKEDA
jgi:P2 family phage major capsid protein